MVHRELEQFVYAEVTREPLLVAYGSRVQFRRVMPNLTATPRWCTSPGWLGDLNRRLQFG